MAKLRNQAEVEEWLVRQPRDVAIVLAARTALRVAPLMAHVRFIDPRAGTAIMLPWFRALAAAWVAALGSTRGASLPFPPGYAEAYSDSVVRSDADAAARSAYAAYAYAGLPAAAADFVVTSVSCAADAAAARYDAPGFRVAPAAARSSSADIYFALSADSNALADGVAPDKLALRKLWPDRQPQWVTDHWQRLWLALDGFPTEENWWVWRDWYEARLRGGSVDCGFETQRVLIPDELWLQGPKLVNAEIVRLMRRDPPPENPTSPLRYDLFLSYSKADEDFAKWVTSLFTSVGLTVFAQFKDISPGSDSELKLQRGLDKSNYLFALLSPDYEMSAHCLEQWSVFLKRGSSGKQRLVPLLIRPISPNSFADEVGYRQVIGLSREDAAKAILEAVGYAGNPPSVPPDYPGAATIEEIGRKTGGLFPVGPRQDGLLNRQPIQPTESDEAGFSPEQLYSEMASEIADFVSHLGKGSGNFSYSGRLQELASKLEISVAVGLSRCDPLKINKNLVWVLRIIALERRDGAFLPNDEVEYYFSDLYGYYRRLEFLFPQLKIYRDVDARHRFVPPDENDERSIREFYRSLGSPEISKEALSPDLSQELKSAGEDIEAAKEIAEAKPGEEAEDISKEVHAEAATKSMSVWGWLANAREKLEKGGQKAGDIEKTIANYEKLYQRVSPHMADYIAYLLKWFL